MWSRHLVVVGGQGGGGDDRFLCDFWRNCPSCDEPFSEEENLSEGKFCRRTNPVREKELHEMTIRCS